jgi:hypothetical protein
VHRTPSRLKVKVKKKVKGSRKKEKNIKGLPLRQKPTRLTNQSHSCHALALDEAF